MTMNLEDLSRSRHGTLGGFGRGCRCEACREARLRYQRDRRRARQKTMTADGFVDIGSSRHGTATGHSRGCRCESCMEASRVYARERYALNHRSPREARFCANCGAPFQGIGNMKYCRAHRTS